MKYPKLILTGNFRNSIVDILQNDSVDKIAINDQQRKAQGTFTDGKQFIIVTATQDRHIDKLRGVQYDEVQFTWRPNTTAADYAEQRVKLYDGTYKS